jgi:hypothetical protein
MTLDDQQTKVPNGIVDVFKNSMSELVVQASYLHD